MNVIKKITAGLFCTVLSVSSLSMTAMAVTEEELAAADSKFAEENAVEENYIASGDYKYSVNVNSDGEEVAFLEEYTGSDTEVEIPDEIDGYRVAGLGDMTFYLNENITQITIPATLEDFGYYPFYGCTALMEFKVDEAHEIYETDSDGAIVGKDGLAIMAYPTGKNPETYTVADGIVAINSSAFAMCTNLREITFPESVEFIGNFAFSECTSLEKIELPDNITAIGNFTFSTCTSLKDIKLPENLQKIGNASFYKCESLDVIEFPANLTEIGQAAFCSTGFTSITIPPTISSIGYSAFGFHTDEEDQIIANENFLVMGYTGTYAQTYCTEHEIDFVSLDDELIEAEPTGTDEEKTISKTVIAVIVIAVLAVVAGVIMVITKKKNKKDNDDNEDGEEDSNENESMEEEE